MVWIYGGDEQNDVWLSEGYVSESAGEEIWQSEQVRRCTNAPLPSAEDRDARTAWLFNSFVRWYTLLGGYRSTEIPLSTCVIGPPTGEDAELADWFQGVPEQGRYRVMIHCNRKIRGEPLGGLNVWNLAYDQLRVLHCRGPWVGRKNQASEFLQRMKNAWEKGPHAMQALLRGSGHQYGFCYDGSESATSSREQ